MLSEEEIIDAIADRAVAVNESCNSYYTNHIQGIIRGLVWALTETDKGAMRNIDDISAIMPKELVPKILDAYAKRILQQ